MTALSFQIKRWDGWLGHTATRGQSREFKLRSLLCSKPRLLITALSCPFEPTEGHFSLLDDFHRGPLPASIIRRVCREIIDVERVEILAGILGSPCQTLVPWARLTSPAFCSTGMVSLEETVMSIPLSLPTQFPSPGMPSFPQVREILLISYSPI